jgi:ribosome biogenesis protein BMS1
LEKSLPFKSKNKMKTVIKGKSTNYEEDDTFLLKKLNLPHVKPIKSYLSEKEKSIYSMLQRLNTIKNIKDKKSQQVKKEILDKKMKEEQRIDNLKKKRNRDKIVKSIIKRNRKTKQDD